MSSIERGRGFGSVLVRLLGVVIALIGLTLTIGGGQLIMLGGSPYYLIVGLLMILSGGLLALLRMTGAWLYILIFIGTVIWALWEVGLNGWALVPRVIAPLVLLILVVLSFPALKREGGGRLALGGIGLILVLGLVSGVVVAQANKARVQSPVPAAGQGGIGDPALIKAGADWPAYGGADSAQRYSPLNQINKDNVKGLQRAWTFRTGDLPEERFGAETTPLKIGDTLYLCSARNRLFALDATTGKQKWTYDPQVADDQIPYTAACRGVTYYAQPNVDAAQPCATRIIEGTLDGRLVAVDARTGAPCAGFGTNGAVSIKTGMGDPYPGMVSITSAPVIVRGVVVTGHQVLDGQKRWNASGVIQGFDAVTGQLRFAWDMMRPDITALPPEGQTYTPGTPNMWTTATADEALGLVFLPMGNSAADYYSGLRRPAENEYSTSLVALDVTTGKPRWHFQTVRKDVWDYDLGSQATLVDMPINGTLVPAVILPSKQGDLYILDRRTGQPLHKVEERRVPQGGVEPSQRSPTQPFSLFHTLRKADLTERDMWGMSPIDQMICRIQFHQAAYDGYFTPPTADRYWIQYPGYNGGSDWGGVAVDPARGVIVANYNDMPNHNRLVPRAEADRLGWFPRDDPRYIEREKEAANRGGNLSKSKAEGAGDPQTGVPYAIDVNAGWRVKFTGLLCKQPPYGGIRAIDIATGKVLWTDVLPAGGQATPMTYEIDGRQYLVIMAGGHHFMETPVGDALVSYALPKQ